MKNKGNIQPEEKTQRPIRVQIVMRSPDGSVNHHPKPSDITYGTLRKY